MTIDKESNTQHKKWRIGHPDAEDVYQKLIEDMRCSDH